MSNQIPLIYEKIAEEINFESLPSEWIKTNLTNFSDKIDLYDYQQEALKNAINLLYYYFESLQKYRSTETYQEHIERKKKLYNEIRKDERDLIDSLGITNKKDKELFNKLKEYYTTTQENSYEKISFLNFLNRMCFWMATGSGKTLVLVKLIEVIDNLMAANLIPKNDILILTHREDLISQIKAHIDEFNKVSNRKIKLWDLTQYDDVKNGNVLAFKENINVFIYRSDLISDQTKEKRLSFEDIENNGRWYVLLDEAHKGDKEDSKRQIYYSILTRDGFLFNFSATFTDIWDVLTTVYNFNLDTFIREGYGKNVYLSQQELNAFQDKEDFNSIDKQKIVLKSLILLTITKKAKEKISKKTTEKIYHNPLLVSLVNSVNVEGSDLEIFFKQLEKIARGDIQKEIIEKAKEELLKEFKEHPRYVFGSEELILNEDHEDLIREVDVKEILNYVFNTSSFGKIEVIKIPQNKEELIFKIKTSEKPFALIKIGDISTWLKNKLDNCEVSESYENKSYFETISHDNNFVNILMGSRAFYEGWDSNRPNVMIFINIGKGDAQKYVIQSIGRGIRIEPIKNKRKRLNVLRKEGDIKVKELYSKIGSEETSLIETLFVFGTNKTNLEKILESIKYERKTSGDIIELVENKSVKSRTLLIPVYKERKEAVKIEELPKFEGNKKLLTAFLEWFEDDRIIYSTFSDYNHDIKPNDIKKIREFLEKGNFKDSESSDIFVQTNQLFNHINIILKDFEKFKQLENEIIHFKRIKVILNQTELQDLKDKIKRVSEYKDSAKEKVKLKQLLESKKIDIDEYTNKIEEISKTSSEEKFKDLKIKNIINHYYLPLIISENDKIDYINHIIKVESERKFIEELEEYLKKDDNLFKACDWWMFSKIDENLDEIYIPYYNKSINKIEKFKPDFIFWLKKGDEYFITFIDPKSTKYTDFEYKVDGYKRIFEKEEKIIIFDNEGIKIRVYLFLYTDDKNKVSEGYKKYWFDNFENIKTVLC
ncbi:MAG: DEAD/DEAH box helicase family protein [Candidatus Woesearchaeota archaeon]